MPAAKPGEIWIVDLGMAAKVRPCLILTPPPRGDELDTFTGCRPYHRHSRQPLGSSDSETVT